MTNANEYNVDNQRLVDDLLTMVGIPSVNTFGLDEHEVPIEEGMAVYFEQRLQELGLSVRNCSHP